MTIFADLHMHSDFSDGVKKPRELPPILKKAGIKCCSLTDHDSIGGLDDFFRIAERHGLQPISGVEISCMEKNHQIHLLGYGFDRENLLLINKLDELRNRRKDRTEKMIFELNKFDLGIELLEFYQLNPGPYWGRPNLANFLLHKGIVASFKEAFDKYLGNNQPAYIPNIGLSLSEGIDLIRNAGGIAILAHPVLYAENFDLSFWSGFDLDGIELYHPRQKKNELKKQIIALARKMNWVISGGSDYHGILPYRAANAMSEDETSRLLSRLGSKLGKTLAG